MHVHQERMHVGRQTYKESTDVRTVRDVKRASRLCLQDRLKFLLPTLFRQAIQIDKTQRRPPVRNYLRKSPRRSYKSCAQNLMMRDNTANAGIECRHIQGSLENER